MEVERLFNGCQWVKASLQIESPDPGPSGRRRRSKLCDRNWSIGRTNERGSCWPRGTTPCRIRKPTAASRSCEELDMYLTPNEALALQEAAKDVFRTKLHNLGVQFAMAVSDKQWNHALEIGQQIIQDFPNSRMCGGDPREAQRAQAERPDAEQLSPATQKIERRAPRDEPRRIEHGSRVPISLARVADSPPSGNRPSHWKSKSDCVLTIVTWSGYAANVWMCSSLRRASKST